MAVMCDRAATSADPQRFVHEALIYASDEEFVTAAVEFLRDGAEAGEPVLLRVDERLQQLALSELGTSDGITLLDSNLYREPLGAIRAGHAEHTKHLSAGATRVRVLGAVPHDPWPSWLNYEAAINQLFADSPVWGVCPYDSRETSDDILDDVERTHPYLSIPTQRQHPSLAYEDPWTLVNGRARAEGERLEAASPQLELKDPTRATVRQALTELAHGTTLEDRDVDALCLSAGQVVANATAHGRPPVRLRAWAADDQVQVTVRDCGKGPTDPFVGMLSRELDGVEPSSLALIRQALTDVSLYTDCRGFTVQMTQRGSG